MQPETAIAPDLRVNVIDDVRGFTELRSQWNDLLRASAADCPFLTWEWLHAWWTHLRGARDLRILTVRAGDELIGVAPLAVSHGPLPWLSRLEFLGTGHAGSDYLDVIIRRDRESESLGTLADCFESQDFALHLDHILTPGSSTAALAGHLADHGWTSLKSNSGACPFAPLAGYSWESYLDTLNPPHRTRCRRYFNTLHKKFDVRFERATSDAKRHDGLAALMGFHDDRWGQRGGSTAFDTPALRAFHEDATQRALESGWLRLYVLRLNGTPAAVTYCFGYNGRFYLYQHGFNAEYQKYSVGLVALELTIKAAIEERALEFDMLYGCEPYKRLWARDTRILGRLDLFPAHIGGRIHQRTIEARQSMRTLARHILPRRGPCETTVTDGAAS